MTNRSKQKQRQVDVACGYALGAYIGVILAWLAIFLGHNAALYALMITAIAGLFGSLRVIVGRLAMRFWLMHVAALLYTKAILICSFYGILYVTAALGVALTVALTLPLYRLFKNDFAKTIPPWLCQACGYPLLGLTEPNCPECGKLFDLTRVPKMSDMPHQKDDRLQ